jgi:hypothetical protein
VAITLPPGAASTLLFYPRAIRIWNMIPPHIIEIENPIAFSNSNNEPPLHNTQSPKLPVKQTNKLKQTNKYIIPHRMRTRSTVDIFTYFWKRLLSRCAY